MVRSLFLVCAAVFATLAASPADAALTSRPQGQRCATENGVCRFAGKATVYYGARNNWAVRRMRGPVRCDNRTFGDPLRGVKKSCYVKRAAPVRVAPPRLRPGVGMTSRPQGKRCAGENQVCRFGGKGRVYYGARNRWAVMTAHGQIGCNNGTFGDPLRGVKKSCFVQRLSAPPPRVQPPRLKPGVSMTNAPRGTFCAKENGVCRFGGNARVYYGARNRWALRNANGLLACNNSTFGDPIPGVVKKCFVERLGAPQQHNNPPIRQPRQPRGGVVMVFEHGNYKGRRQQLRAGRWDMHQLNQVGNDRISSITVPPGMEVIAFEHARFSGRSQSFRGNVGFVGHAFNDKISSLIVRRAGGAPPRYNNPPVRQPRQPRQPRGGVVMVFEHGNYKGRRQQLRAGRWDMHQLKQVGNDRISSITVPPGMEVIAFEHARFSGRRKVFRGNAAFVGHGFNDKISSMIVRRYR